jgi:glycosyltransferase involved in cell wall biosynthesis
MQNKPEFSVIIPLYNKGPYIACALNSVLAQSFQDFEIIVVDDGSTDAGAEIVRGFKDPRILLIHQDNKGESVARNRGIETARAEMIAFLDADDEWLPGFLETILRLIKKYPDAGAYATAFIKKFPNGILQKQVFLGIPSSNWEGIIPSYFRSAAQGRLPVNSSNVAIPKRIFSDVGMFPIGFWWGEDSDMWGRIALKYPIGFSSTYCAFYHVGATNRICNSLRSTVMHPFVQTARRAIEDGSVRASMLLDLERYIAKEILTTVHFNLRAGRPDLARKDLADCHINGLYIKRIILYIWTYLPTSLFRLKEKLLEYTLYNMLRIKKNILEN